MISNKKLYPVVTELFTRVRKLRFLWFLLCNHIQVPKDARLNTTQFFMMKIPSIKEPQQTAINHSSDIDFDEFNRPYGKYTTEPYSFLGIDVTLPSNNGRSRESNHDHP